MTSPSPGSSPRVWGLRASHDSLMGLYRFIPTCVGTTLSTTSRGRSGAVHPHVCGDYFLVGQDKPRPHGSSPRVWGLL